ncbi:hypothetical protein ACVDG8_004750 [Mesorhizobium sp. ORM8.1]
MKYEWASNPHLFIPVTFFFVVAFLSAAAIIIAMLSIFLRTDSYGSIDEQNLPWSERWGKRDTRRYADFWSPRFLTARRVIAYGALVFICSFGGLALITAVFGHPS